MESAGYSPHVCDALHNGTRAATAECDHDEIRRLGCCSRPTLANLAARRTSSKLVSGRQENSHEPETRRSNYAVCAIRLRRQKFRCRGKLLWLRTPDLASKWSYHCYGHTSWRECSRRAR